MVAEGEALKPLIAIVLWAYPLSTHLLAADFNSGQKAYDRGDYVSAAKEWRAAADKGDAAAEYWLGTLYESGRGVDKDELAGRQLELRAAEDGYEYAQNALAWPIKPEDTPYLTCTPFPATAEAKSDEVTQADSIKGFRFEVTLHNARPAVERPILSADQVSPQREGANISIAVYRLDKDRRRVEVPHSFGTWGVDGGNSRGAILDESVIASVRIPVEEAERRIYIEQFLAMLSRSPNQTREQVQRTRQMMLHSEQPNEPSYIDEMMPNRLGVYEIVCRYQSQRQGFWPVPLEAPPLRFEYVKTMDWIEIFNRKREPPK